MSSYLPLNSSQVTVARTLSVEPDPLEGFLFASLGHRFVALAVDALAALPVGYVTWRWSSSWVWTAAVLLVLWVVNRVAFQALTGRSLGKVVTGLQVVPAFDPDVSLGWGRAVAREALTLVWLVPALVCVWLFFAGNPFVDPVAALVCVWLACALLLPVVALVRSVLRQCPVTDGVCRTVVLSD